MFFVCKFLELRRIYTLHHTLLYFNRIEKKGISSHNFYDIIIYDIEIIVFKIILQTFHELILEIIVCDTSCMIWIYIVEVFRKTIKYITMTTHHILFCFIDK